MPMTDYLCDACSTRVERFFHAPPDTLDCAECEGGTARRIYSLPGEYQPRNARGFDPIVIWVNNEDSNKISFPGRSDEPVQEGYHAVSITNLNEADRWTGKLNKIALDEAIENRAGQKAYFEERSREHRETIIAKIGSNHRMLARFKAICEHRDRKRDAKFSRPMDPRGHFQALSFDASNRQGYSDAETGWRDRK